MTPPALCLVHEFGDISEATHPSADWIVIIAFLDDADILFASTAADVY